MTANLIDGLLTNGQLGEFYQTNTQTEQARPTKQQRRNLTGQTMPREAASDGFQAGSLPSQQSAKSSARLASTAAHGARKAQNCTCSDRTQHVQFAKLVFLKPAGFAGCYILVPKHRNSKKNKNKS